MTLESPQNPPPDAARPQARLYRCPLCNYLVESIRCPECGNVLYEEHDQDLLRHLIAADGPRVLRAARLIAAAPTVFLASLLQALVVMPVGGLLNTPVLATIAVIVFFAGMLASGCILMAGVWSLTRLPPSRDWGISRFVRPATTTACVLPWIIASVSVTTLTLDPIIIRVSSSLSVAAFAVMAWALATLLWRLWILTASARYDRGVRRFPPAISLLMFKATIVVWAVVTIATFFLNESNRHISTLRAASVLSDVCLAAMTISLASVFVADLRAELAKTDQASG